MKIKLLILFSFYLLLQSCTNAQSSSSKNNNSITTASTCIDGRFEKDIFSDLKIHRNIKYHRGKTMQKQAIDLKMDIFEPENDPAALRPLVIWAHGGYFCFGDKSNFHSLCQFVSRKGWVSASIDYRKWRKHVLPDSLEYMETAIRATHDMHAAIRFFKADAAGPNHYKIDTNKIFVGGYSAGGIMAAQVAYLDNLEEVPSHLQTILERNGGIAGNNAYPEHSSTIAGAIVIAGAIYNTHIIEKGTHPPFLGIQGTKDEIVPYNRGWARSPTATNVIQLDGTANIHKTNKTLNLPSTLLTLPRGDHSAAWDELWVERTQQYIHTFLLENTCGK